MQDDVAPPGLHPLLSTRWSPTMFDSLHDVEPPDVALLLEAARWAPSASLLIANLTHRYVENSDWEFSEFSLYDLGQAVAHITLQAQGLGLSGRQRRPVDEIVWPPA